MGLRICLPSGEDLLSPLGFVTLKGLLLGLEQYLLLKLLRFQISEALLFRQFRLNTSVDVRLCGGSGLLDGGGDGGGSRGRGVCGALAYQ